MKFLLLIILPAVCLADDKSLKVKAATLAKALHVFSDGIYELKGNVMLINKARAFNRPPFNCHFPNVTAPLFKRDDKLGNWYRKALTPDAEGYIHISSKNFSEYCEIVKDSDWKKDVIQTMKNETQVGRCNRTMLPIIARRSEKFFDFICNHTDEAIEHLKKGIEMLKNLKHLAPGNKTEASQEESSSQEESGSSEESRRHAAFEVTATFMKFYMRHMVRQGVEMLNQLKHKLDSSNESHDHKGLKVKAEFLTKAVAKLYDGIYQLRGNQMLFNPSRIFNNRPFNCSFPNRTIPVFPKNDRLGNWFREALTPDAEGFIHIPPKNTAEYCKIAQSPIWKNGFRAFIMNKTAEAGCDTKMVEIMAKECQTQFDALCTDPVAVEHLKKGIEMLKKLKEEYASEESDESEVESSSEESESTEDPESSEESSIEESESTEGYGHSNRPHGRPQPKRPH